VVNLIAQQLTARRLFRRHTVAAAMQGLAGVGCFGGRFAIDARRAYAYRLHKVKTGFPITVGPLSACDAALV
jgi:hypothetical protein